jgi:hypothetical protein
MQELNFFEYVFEFAKKIDYEIADFCNSFVNDTTVTKNYLQFTLLLFRGKDIDIV